MRTSVVCALAGLVAGCAEAATNPNTTDFGGNWQYVETLIDLPNGISCADTGVYRLTQMGEKFAGDYVQVGVCRTTMGVLNNADSGGVAGGRVIGRTLRFTVDQVCEYDGALDHATGKINGRVLCVLIGQDTLRLTGNWSATR
jgi:hypothetical protein